MTETRPKAPVTDAPAADIRPTAPRRLLVALIVTELMITFALATPIVATLGLKVQEIAPDRKEQVLATVMAVGSIAALLLNPVFGHLSDRTTGRFGRRRPWIAGGLVVGLPAGAVMATAHSTTQLVLGWLLAQAAYNAALAALSAVIADRVPPAQQATMSGLFGAAGFAGIVPGLVLVGTIPGNTTALFLIPAAIGVLGAVLAWLLLREPAVPGGADRAGKAVNLRSVLGSLLFDPRTSPAFTVVWCQRFLLQFANALIGAYGLYFLMARLDMSVSEAAALVSATGLVSLAGNVLAAAVFGRVASRTGAYRALVVGSGTLMTAAMVIKMFSASVWPVYLATAVAAVGLGAFYAVDLALVLRVMPDGGDSARYLGVFNIAKALPQTLAPVLAPVLLALGSDPVGASAEKNYFALFLGGAVAALLATALTPLIRHPRLVRD
ncbi:MFS transporter [Streptomyces sp. NBC_00257]|uniref:MFS transporter n=1 Tax=unclassified Streptomyces TaxID=2593676 RepID=UPI00224E7BFE|nr:MULTISPECIES: MFS transporter [unclassified Streptomyces]WTB53442.1 MFS transporter [Streptomyces sp. NBC_00826]WTH93667.1 MFS transporter [Streptomyces sp. NBC_00825]WTI02401.1 MFS transporter [Streptomyces sp. NBC_00822]MCX4868032.1 MFS transporter [Streptomyces sp. NBC_00906]MCX4899270.1 MFS transporter [Streptomyces sp. NBC_00892]